MLLDGVHIPLTTPFYPDGRVYLRKLEHNVRRYSLTPVNGLAALTGISETEMLSDTERRFATPLTTLPRGKFGVDAAAIGQVVARHDVGGLVFGLPVNMDGSEGPRAQATRAFVRNLAPLIDRPIAFWDERLSTAAVTRTMLEADLSRAKRAASVDRLAAAYILQGALDRMTRLDATSSF